MTDALAQLNVASRQRKLLGLALLKSLAVPLILLAFFFAAPRWWNARVRDSIIAEVNAITTITAADKAARIRAVTEMNFQRLCKSYPPYLEHLHQGLVNSGVCGHFRRLEWGLLGAAVLVATLVSGLFVLLLLNRWAKASVTALIANYRWGWRIAMALALFNVVLVVPLLAFASFEFTVLLADRFFPKLLLVLLIGGAVAVWACARILLTKVPLEFGEIMARELTTADAPELWRDVNDAAARLNTAPPTHIIVGMQLNFYVTELAVHHSGGKTEGKTLFLSYPLLKQLPEQEVLAIIGHELGHFIGEDTALSRLFYPLRLKVGAVMNALAGAGWAGWPALQLLHSFAWGFEGVATDHSRKREFLADRKGAELTTARSQASALVRLHIVLESFNRGLVQAAASGTANPFDVPCANIVAGNFTAQDAFWSDLFQKSQPHPLDSHPPLHARLAALSESIDAEQACSLAHEKVLSAFDVWFSDRENLFASLVSEAKQALHAHHEHAKLTEADSSTPEGRELLEQAFPQRIWHGRAVSFWLPIILLVLLAAGFGAAFVFTPDTTARAVFVAIIGALMALAGWHWLVHRNAKLILSSTGLAYSGWARPLPFQEIAQISVRRQYSNIILDFRLKPGFVSPGKLLPYRFQHTALSMAHLNDKPLVIADAVFSYFQRRQIYNDLAQHKREAGL